MIKTIARATLLLTLVMLLPLSMAATQATVQGAASLFIMGPDGLTKNMELKATKDGSGVKQVQDFELGAENVVSVPLGGSVTVWGDLAVEFNGAKLTPAGTIDSLDIPIIQGKINLAGVAQGVYTLDVIVGNNAYECIVVIGQNPQQIITNQITQINTDNNFAKIFEKGKSNPNPSPSPEPSICYFKPNDADECKPVDGKCPNNWPMNEAGNCHPGGKCPTGFERVDDDETGTCYSEKNTFHCPSGAIVLDEEDCAIYEPDATPTPEATPTPTPAPSAELKEETPTPTPEAQDEPLDSNCGGEPCTATEKEDSWLSDGPEKSPGVPAPPESESFKANPETDESELTPDVDQKTDSDETDSDESG
jgi:hypothetical protein